MRFALTTLTTNPASVGCTIHGPDSEVAAQITPLERIRNGYSQMPAVSLGAGPVTVKSRWRREDQTNL